MRTFTRVANMSPGLRDTGDEIDAEHINELQQAAEDLQTGALPIALAGIEGALDDYAAADSGTPLGNMRAGVANALDYPGIDPTGVSDSLAALQAAADYARTNQLTYSIPQGVTVRISDTLDLRYIRSIDIQGIIKVGHTTGVGVLIGNSSTIVRDVRIRINEISYAGTQSNVALRAVGLKNGRIAVNICPYLQLYADAADATMSSIAYTDWDLGKIDLIELYGETALSWINENRFWGGRVQRLKIGSAAGGYHHNHNKFYDNNFESPTIELLVGNNNRIYGARMEGTTPVITFGVDTWNNTIERTWQSNYSVRYSPATMSDSGLNNRLIDSTQQHSALLPILRIDAASRTTDTCSAWSGSASLIPGFRKLVIPTNSVLYASTGVIPIGAATSGEAVACLRHLVMRSSHSSWRPEVRVYDAARQPLDGGSAQYISLVGGWSWSTGNGGRYVFTTNVGTGPRRIVPIHPDVAYIRVDIYGGSATAGSAFEFLELLAYVEDTSSHALVDVARRQLTRPLYQASSTPPAKSLLHRGDQIGTDSGILTVTHRVDTTASAASSGASTITAASASGISSGDTIAVLLDNDVTHFTTVNGEPVGNDVAIADVLPSNVLSGAPVATQRWVHLT